MAGLSNAKLHEEELLRHIICHIFQHSYTLVAIFWAPDTPYTT
jgi:hypothetical protein